MFAPQTLFSGFCASHSLRIFLFPIQFLVILITRNNLRFNKKIFRLKCCKYAPQLALPHFPSGSLIFFYFQFDFLWFLLQETSCGLIKKYFTLKAYHVCFANPLIRLLCFALATYFFIFHLISYNFNYYLSWLWLFHSPKILK